MVAVAPPENRISRAFSPGESRFFSDEPSDREGCGIAQNWYSYCSNNPVKYVDPSGLSEDWAEDSRNLKAAENAEPVETILEDTDAYTYKSVQSEETIINDDGTVSTTYDMSFVLEIKDTEEGAALADAITKGEEDVLAGMSILAGALVSMAGGGEIAGVVTGVLGHKISQKSARQAEPGGRITESFTTTVTTSGSMTMTDFSHTITFQGRQRSDGSSSQDTRQRGIGYF